MVFFNYSTMQMAAKVVYYGPGLCGKTTNLHHVYAKTSSECRGEMVSLETETDRTLFFDLLPIDVGQIAGFNTRIQLYTVPGQVFYNTTRKLVLKGVDGVVFVADSQRAMLEANADSLANLEANLAEMGLSLDEVPLVLQYNKRDLEDICTVDELNAAINRSGRPYFEASAIQGQGVFETLKGISKLTLLSLTERLSSDRAAPSLTPAPQAVAPAAAASASSTATATETATATATRTAPADAASSGAFPRAVPPAAAAATAPPSSAASGAPAAPAERETAVRRLSERDVFDELERLRRDAIRPLRRPSAAPAGNGVAGIPSLETNGNGAGRLRRDIHLTLPRATLDRARRFSVTVSVEDDEQRVVETIRDVEVDVAGDSLSQILLQLAIDAAPES